ncbi:hypothetical protein [Streptosporangium sp. NPDC000396]|uniref:hypothetical protein n=1 Tax=Streptosporangium sp. NPDC000396 TaxID=3366185 RepID=UPI0036C781FD
MSVVDSGLTEASIEEQAAEGELTFQQINKLIKGLGEAGVINLNATLNSLLGPINNVLGEEEEPPTARVEFLALSHYVFVGRNPH